MKKQKQKEPHPRPSETDISEPESARLTAAWAGPLPPPSALAQFNDIVENGAERIIAQWETESRHRRDIEKRELALYGWSEILGKAFAFVFLLIAMAVTAYAIYLGQQWAAVVLGGGTIGAVVWAFVMTNKADK